MNELQRITTQYIEAQDRIQLLGEHTSGAPEMIWLTQRLLSRLLPHVLAWLQQQTPVTRVHGALAVQADLMQGFAQQAARSQLAEQAPVQSQAQSASWLALAVDISHTPETLRLTFRCDAQQATLVFAAQPLRQWLGIVHDQYCMALWPLDVWPQWLQDSSPAKQQPGVVLH